MTKSAHTFYISTLVLIVLVTFLFLCYIGIPYYRISVEERFFFPSHSALKPSGVMGHGFGIVGTLLIIIGISIYMARKRFRFMSRMGNLKHWLEFHIFLCTLGPLLVLFHTSFKFGGIVAISFWSMVAVFLSGIVGRFIYVQIPRTIEGRELSLSEVRNMKTDTGTFIKNNYRLDEESLQTITASINKESYSYHPNYFVRFFRRYSATHKNLQRVKSVLKKNHLSRKEQKKVIAFVKEDISLSRKIDRLLVMQKLFKYWHVAHMPFALVMIIIMVIHVVVTLTFGYKWIF